MREARNGDNLDLNSRVPPWRWCHALSPPLLRGLSECKLRAFCVACLLHGYRTPFILLSRESRVTASHPPHQPEGWVTSAEGPIRQPEGGGSDPELGPVGRDVAQSQSSLLRAA